MKRAVVACAIAVLAPTALAFASCARTGPDDSESDAGVVEAGPPPPVDAGPPIQTSDKLDVLFVVDSSKDLDFAHALLADGAAYLMGRLASPACVDGLGNVVAKTRKPTDACPMGLREFAPVTDVHVAVVSTSLGGHGADSCSPIEPGYQATENDGAHLLPSDTHPIPGVTTYEGQGFLDWDPMSANSPPGIGDLGTFNAQAAAVLNGVGDKGCRFPAQLESFYRFLIDPTPYGQLSLSQPGGDVIQYGADSTVLLERQDFLRHDSAVAVVLLSGEDDCSIRDEKQNYLAAEADENGAPYHVPRGRSICATEPQSPCCASCAFPAPSGCTPNESDPACALPPFDATEDPLSLRCYEQKRRFGVDFLQPTSRYVDGLSKTEVPDSEGKQVKNPLFQKGRAPELVVFAAIVGVPWPDVSEFPTTLAAGYFPGSQVDWPSVIGDPSNYVPPADPLMLESPLPRTGANPASHDALEPPDAGPLANAINGHERLIPNHDALEYACIYPRTTKKDCVATADCDCAGDPDTNPICQAPNGSYGQYAFASGATPGLRELTVVKGLGDRGIAASICALETKDQASSLYGYRPAIDAVLRALRKRLL